MEEHYLSAAHAYMEFAASYPVEYVQDALNVTPHTDQRNLIQALADPNVPQISWKSANGVGKTYFAASCIAQYLDTHRPGYAIVSGASWTGIMKTVWPTFKKLHRNANVDLGGELLSSEWRRGDMWGAFCVSPDTPENFSGFRTKHGALVIVDEASALSYETMEAIRGLCSAKGSKIVLLGNPLRPEGPFYDTFSSSEWENFHTSAFDVADLGIPGLATQEWIESMGREYGTDSPVYSARVKGEFPDSSTDTLIKLGWLKKVLAPKLLRPMGRKRMGVDVARFGDDRTVLLIRDHRSIVDVLTYTKKSTTEVAGLVLMAARKYGVQDEDIHIDDTGVGGGVTDSLHEQGFYANPVNFGERALERDRFANVRAELYWQIRKRMDDSSKDLFYIPKQFASVIKECTWVRYKIRSNGTIILEAKDEIKKRMKRSPDLGDALALSFAGDVDGYGFEAA